MNVKTYIQIQNHLEQDLHFSREEEIDSAGWMLVTWTGGVSGGYEARVTLTLINDSSSPLRVELLDADDNGIEDISSIGTSVWIDTAIARLSDQLDGSAAYRLA